MKLIIAFLAVVTALFAADLKLGKPLTVKEPSGAGLAGRAS